MTREEAERRYHNLYIDCVPDGVTEAVMDLITQEKEPSKMLLRIALAFGMTLGVAQERQRRKTK